MLTPESTTLLQRVKASVVEGNQVPVLGEVGEDGADEAGNARRG